jgi:lysophospholipid acyltransferase (LPLAT)-like uncharacterized protein
MFQFMLDCPKVITALILLALLGFWFVVKTKKKKKKKKPREPENCTRPPNNPHVIYFLNHRNVVVISALLFDGKITRVRALFTPLPFFFFFFLSLYVNRHAQFF